MELTIISFILGLVLAVLGSLIHLALWLRSEATIAKNYHEVHKNELLQISQRTESIVNDIKKSITPS